MKLKRLLPREQYLRRMEKAYRALVEILIRVSSRNGLTRDEVATAARRLAKEAARSIGDAPYINLDLVDTRIEF